MSGSDTENIRPPVTDTPLDEEVDEELLALAPPPPSFRQALFIILFLILSGFMTVWFFPEMQYLLHAVGGPVELGDAPDVDDSALVPHTYVAVNGLPVVNRTIVYNEGVKWFAMSDNEQKMFPLSGSPNFFVQWTIPEEHKAFGASPPLPAHFEGHLATRDDMGPNFDRVWLFFDCLEVHSLTRCKYCLGRNSMEECRDAFTCVEHNTSEECGEILERSEENLQSEISSGQEGAGHAKELLAAVKEHNIAVASIRLEEMASRTRSLAHRLEGKGTSKDINALRRQILQLRLKELEIRAMGPLGKVSGMAGASRTEVESNLTELDALRKVEPDKIDRLKTYRAFIEIGDELDKLKRRSRWIRKMIADPETASDDILAMWKIDPNKAPGEEILRALGNMEQALSHSSGVEIPDADAGVSDEVDAGPDALATDAGTPPPPPQQPLAEMTESDFEDPARWRVYDDMQKLYSRASSLQKRVARVKLGEVSKFEQWSRQTRTVLHLCRGDTADECRLPEGLRADEVVSSLDELETMLEAIPTSDPERARLETRMSDAIDDLDATRASIKELSARAGVRELEVVRPLQALSAQVAAVADDGIDDAEAELTRTRHMLMEKGFLQAQFRGVPEEMTALSRALEPSSIEELQVRTDAALDASGRQSWILVDGETPLDKIWVVAVYLLLLVMVILNLRKLWRFWIAWRA